ncbi:MAG: DUF3187 domain-containing protein, partial [Campylobacterota bacterium]|nr:DUF3187 domain-containing protein [Campylobacterota bacterium]
ISAINISYTILGVNIFGGYSHTTIKDEINIDETDIDTYNLGFGFDPLERLYSSISYNNSTTLYSDVENIETLSLYNFYSIDNSWFTTLTYQYGISQSASKHTLSLKVGYYF